MAVHFVQVSSDSVVCHSCWTAAWNQIRHPTSEQQNAPTVGLGHACISCGKSLLRIRSHTLFGSDSPREELIRNEIAHQIAPREYLLAAVVAAVSAAPPGPQQRYPQQAGLHQINPLDYFLEQPVDNYYRPAEQKQVSANGPNGAPARLESLEPDSEVELVPGVQQPQQPPQQNPVAPNIPGLLPGQRVFIVHMPIPGYSPGSIGGYQPVYIVAAGPQGNGRFPGNGYQNAVLLDPSGQGVLNPYGGYPRGLVQPQVLGPLAYPNRPYDLVYQDPGLANPAGQPIQGEAGRGPIHFSQNVGLQGPVNQAAYPGPAAQLAHPGQVNARAPNGAPAQLKQGSEETKEAVEAKSNHRAQALTRNKA